MITFYKKNGQILREIENELINSNKIDSPKEWLKKIIENFSVCKRFMNALVIQILKNNSSI